MARVCAGIGLALALSASPALAFEGRVQEVDGTPIVGADVSVVGRTGVARTDTRGRFQWPGTLQPPFELVVRLSGGRVSGPHRVDRLPEPGPLVVAVEPLFEEAVTVTAGSAPHTETTPAAATELLGGREIELRVPAHVAQLLENVPGASAVSEGRASVPALRGLARGRTLLLVDGARVASERRVGPSATFLDPIVLDSVEVVRGSGAVAYGSDALGGVIHLRTRSATPGSGDAGRFVGSLGAGVPERRVALELGRGFEQGGVLVQGHYRDQDDYDSPSGRVDDSGATDYGVAGKLEHVAGGGWLSVAWQTDRARDVERPRTNSRSVRFVYPREDSDRVVAAWDVVDTIGFEALGVSAFVGRYRLVTEQDTLPGPESPRSVERADVSAHDFHVRVTGRRPAGDARVRLGAELTGRTGLEALDVVESYTPDDVLDVSRTNVSIDDARRLDAGAWAVVEAPEVRRVRFEAGLRGDRVTTRNRGGFFGSRSTARAAASGFVAATAGPYRGWSVTAQAARGFRDPTLSDRYYRGPTGRGFVTGEPGLEPETSRQFDLALRWSASRLRLAAYGFDYEIDGLVERYETDPDTFVFRNRGRARLRGVEIEAQADLGARVRVELAGHRIRGEALDDDQPLDDVPPDTLSLRVGVSLGRGWVQVRGAGYRSDARPGPTEQPRDGYAVVDVAAGLALGESVELRLLARNLLDEEWLVSPDRRAVPAPGRSATLTAVVEF